jgi:hypothetical protein
MSSAKLDKIRGAYGVLIKGEIDRNVYDRMAFYFECKDEDDRPPDLDQFIIECAVWGFEEICKRREQGIVG